MRFLRSVDLSVRRQGRSRSALFRFIRRGEKRRIFFLRAAPFVSGKWAMPEEGPPMDTKRAAARFFVGGSASRLTQISNAMGVVWRRGKDVGACCSENWFWCFLCFRAFCELKMGHAGGRPSHGHEARCRAVLFVGGSASHRR